MIRFIHATFASVLLALSAFSAELKVASLNCYLLFDPAMDHRGKVDDANRLTPEQYRQKLSNLATLTKGYEVVGVQETGGKAEVQALAQAADLSWAWAQGNDTATGEEVGLLHHLPGWTVTPRGRIGSLDKIVSKHLLVTATRENEKILFLVVHLLRPIGPQAEKQAKQREAIGAWMREVLTREPKSTVVVLGDTNNSDKGPLYGLGKDAGDLNNYAATHLTGKCFDRLVVAGAGAWSAVEVKRPPYGPRPNDLNKRLWTDHFFVGATLRVD